MNEAINYYFQNNLGIRIESRDPAAHEFYDQEYAHSKGEIPEGASIVSLLWGKSSMRRESKSDFRFNRHKWLARWHYRLNASETGIRIEAYGNKVALPMVHHMLVHPALRLLGAQDAKLMLHCAAIVKNGRSLLFAGSGGSGKTTTTSLVLERGGSDWKLHADDYVFIVKDHQSAMYLTRSHLYRDILKWLPRLRNQLSFRERLHLELFGRIRQISGDKIKWPLRIAEKRLWPNHSHATNAGVGALLLIRREDVEHPQLERIVDERRLRADLLGMNFYEVRHFIDLVNKTQSNLNAGKWVDRWKQLESDLLEVFIRTTPNYWLILPKKNVPGDTVGSELLKILTPLTEAEEIRED